MTKSDCLKALMLLSALESILLSQGKPMPDFLQEDIGIVMDALRKAVLQ